MALKYIPQSWKDDMQYNFAHNFNFYLNPRGRVFPALTSAGINYLKNTVPANMRGTYRMQCGASTDLTYAYKLPQRFIIEAWFKPEFAYDVAGDQNIFNVYGTGVACSLFYRVASDQFRFYTTSGGTSAGTDCTAFTTNDQLQRWIYVRCYYDNTASKKGFYCTANGVNYCDTESSPSTGSFDTLNTISFMSAVATESSYWIIHELDETLTTGQYKTYQADRQIIFDFNGTTLGRERIRLPRNAEVTDMRGVKSFSISKSVEKNGSAGANTADLSLYNIKGQFSDDQYAAFDPFQGYYNGTMAQTYLRNRVGVEIESKYSRAGVLSDVPNGTTPIYFQDAWATTDSWTTSACTISVASGVVTAVTSSTTGYLARTISYSAGDLIRARVKNISGSGAVRIVNQASQIVGNATIVGNDWDVVSVTAAYSGTGLRFRPSQGATGTVEIDWIYVGDGTYLSDPILEPLFIGRTTPGAFKRTSPNKFFSTVAISAEDGIAELGETKLGASHAYNNSTAAYVYSSNADESLSLVHLLSRLVTKHEIRNYALNSSFENATIANSWYASALTLSRSSTFAQFGTYSGKAIATAAQAYSQDIKFETADFIDLGDTFNLSAYVYQTVASSVEMTLYEYDNTGALIGAGSLVDSSANTGIWERINIGRTILSPSCTRLRIVFAAIVGSTFYVDGVMLTRGIDPIDYVLINSNDGTSGTGSAESAAIYLYDTVGFDLEEVSLSHPYAIVSKGETVWDHLKDIGEATLCRYIGMTSDGVLKYEVAYNATDPTIIGDVENIASVNTLLEVNGVNSIKVQGILIDKKTTNTPVLFDGSRMGGVEQNTGGKLFHRINDGALFTVSGATVIEAQYTKDDA